MSSRNVAFIDVGSCNIRTIIAKMNGLGAQIQGVSCVASRGIHKGIVVDIDEAAAAIRRSVEKAQGIMPSRVQEALVGFCGKHISSANPMVTVDTDRNHMVSKSAILQAEREIQATAFPEDRAKVNIIRRQYAIDLIGGIKNPLGMHGYRLDLEAHIVTADWTYMQNLAIALRQAGLAVRPGSFVANPLACAEAVLEAEEKQQGVVLADIGGGTTGIAVFRDGSIYHTSALPVGGRQVTNDLAIGLDIPFSKAEELKLKCVSLYADDAVEDAVAETLQGYNVSAEQIAYIVRARMEEILRMVVAHVPEMPGNLVVTGGGAKMRGFERYAQEVLKVRARVGRPTALPGEGTDDPANAAAVGLVLWGTGSKAVAGDGYGDGEEEALFQPIASALAGLRAGWLTLWSRRPRIVFGPASPAEKIDVGSGYYTTGPSAKYAGDEEEGQ